MLSRHLTTHFKHLGAFALVLVAASYALLPQLSFGQAASDSLEVWSLMRKAAEKVAPSVVQIETLGGLERVEGNYYAAGPSTGTILSEDGLIVTSAYALLHQPTTILVRFANGERRAAEKIATDHARGLVLLRAS
ncbi:MAG: S1C family serine protease, partial [Planctomycetota bacterium]|nr:S1C family serine protease [Planctomycetota bacterium]